MIAMIAEKKFSDGRDHLETTFQRSQRPTIAEIELFLSQRSLSLRLLRSLESGFHMIPTIAELVFLSDRSDHSARSDHMKTRLKTNPTLFVI